MLTQHKKNLFLYIRTRSDIIDLSNILCSLARSSNPSSPHITSLQEGVFIAIVFFEMVLLLLLICGSAVAPAEASPLVLWGKPGRRWMLHKQQRQIWHLRHCGSSSSGFSCVFVGQVCAAVNVLWSFFVRAEGRWRANKKYSLLLR